MVYKSSASSSDTETTRVCTKCDLEKPLEQFHKANGGKHRRRVCKECMHKRQKALATSTPERVEARRLDGFIRNIKKQYGLKYKDFEVMWDAQRGICKICDEQMIIGDKFKAPHIDHCHTTGAIRGILCFMCNTGLGKFRDSPDLLDRAKDYLEDKDAYYRTNSAGDSG